MILKEVIQKSLEELKDIAKIKSAILLEDGTCYAGTLEEEKIDRTLLRPFLASEAEFQELAGFYLFRIEEEERYILILCASRGDGAVIGRLVVAQIRNLILVNQEKNSRDNFLKSLLEGKISEELAFAKAEKFHMDLEDRRAVFLIEMKEGRDEGIFEIIKNIEEVPETDILFKIEENRIVLMKKVGAGEGEEQLNAVARILVDMINVEAMAKARVSYGTVANGMMKLSGSYQEAKMALDVGRIFYAEKNTISFRKLGIGRLLYRLPRELCETFMKEVVGTSLEKVLDPETLSTINRFFENGLNVSETARQLYVHRNTLVYRLEKIQKQLGLDIRQFDDAVTFKIAMMVDNYLKWERGK